MPQPGLMQ